MKTRFLHLGGLAALVMIAAACNPKEKLDPTPAPTVKDEVVVTSEAAFTVLSDGGTVAVRFSSSGKWTAALSNDRAASWLSISPSSGEKGNGSITLSAAKNEESDERSATVRISCGSASASVTLTQKQKDALTQTPSKTQFGAEGGSFTIEVKSNVEYGFEVGADWIHQADTKSLTTKTTTFTVDVNDDARKREGTVTVKSALGSEKITIYQEAAEPSVILSTESVSVPADGGSFTVDVNTNVDVTMGITSGADWLSEVSTKAMSTHSYSFLAAPNESRNAREGKIAFNNEASGMEAIVTVTQAPEEEALMISQSVYDIGADGGSISVEVSANVDLNVQVSQSWVRQVSTKSMSTRTYAFEVDANPDYGVRECEITFSGAAAGGPEGFPASSTWSVIGTIGGDTWTRDIGMKTNGTWHAAFSVPITASDEFKFRQNGNWTVNLGAVSAYITTVGANTPVSLRQDGSNMKIAAGTYDIYLNPASSLAYFLPAGEPFPYGALSGAVTVRQQGQEEKEISFADPVLKRLLEDASFYDSGLDVNRDGRITNKDLRLFSSLIIGADNFSRVAGTVTSLEDLGYFTNAEFIFIDDGGASVSAPLPESLSALSSLKHLRISECGVSGNIPDSYTSLTSLQYFHIAGCKMEGEFPTSLLSLPELKEIMISDCPGMHGAVNLTLGEGSALSYINLENCNFESLTVVAKSPQALINQPYISFYPQKNVSRGKIIFRSAADGMANIHPDGEAVRYHTATKGPGLDIFITGDGFTPANNAVGGTLETYMKHAAESMMSTEPFNKLMDYFNIWLVYAHSEVEGTAIEDQSTAGQKFGTFQPNLRSTTCMGDFEAIQRFVKSATGRDEPSGTVALLMNSSYYGGMCFMAMQPLYSPGLSVGFVPVCSGFSCTVIHEVLGHGFGKLGDEYDAGSASSDQAGNTDETIWPLYGIYSNFDNVGDPQTVRWHQFIFDSRYASENIGVYEGANLSNHGWYRPSVNSIMRSHSTEGGDRFNAPSREAIWQRVHILTHPEEKWSSWEDYVNNGYDREEFVRFDLTPAPASSSARAPRLMRSPERTLPGGRKVGELPPLAPPVILNYPEKRSNR